jgi:hypothetical protein
MVSSHPAEPARVDLAVKQPDNMLVVNEVAVNTVVSKVVSNKVVSSVAKKERETWTTTRKISVLERPELRIAAARIAS